MSSGDCSTQACALFEAADWLICAVGVWERLLDKYVPIYPLALNKALQKESVHAARWCSGQAYWALDPTTRVRISHGLLWLFMCAEGFG